MYKCMLCVMWYVGVVYVMCMVFVMWHEDVWCV